MKIKYSRDALKFLAKVQKNVSQNIRNAINMLPQGDVKRMQGFDDGRMRLRVGKFRIIFRYDIDNGSEIIYIIDIGSRGEIYK